MYWEFDSALVNRMKGRKSSIVNETEGRNFALVNGNEGRNFLLFLLHLSINKVKKKSF